MATVYLARDLRHDRPVAVKVLREELSASVGEERFHREIRIAASLQHPHIVPLLDSGDHAGQRFYVMPYIDGQTLRQALASGPLAIDRVVALAGEVADGLAAAHAAGIVHRDLKPENVLLSHGHALIADFGVARPIREASANLTQVGFVVGTPTYMAPEQAFGEEGIDGRADVYALGVLVFELLTGSPPLVGATAQATITRRLTELPPRVRRLRPDTPEWLDALVAQLLAREPGERPAHAAAVREALHGREVGVAPTPVGGQRREVPSILVVPFANIGADPDHEFFSDGISEELIIALAQVSQLRVIARTSAFALKGKPTDVRTIGRELGVQHIVEGSVRRAGQQLRVTAQLVDTDTGSPRWSGRFDRALHDVFAIQDEISAAVRDAIVGSLVGGQASGRYQTDLETYDLFLRGRYLLSTSATRLADALAALTSAAQRDPAFVPAIAALAVSRAYAAMLGQLRESGGWDAVRADADRLALLAPASPERHHVEGIIALGFTRDYDATVLHFQRVLEANPNESMAHGLIALALFCLGDTALGQWHARRTVATDPLSPFMLSLAANHLAFTGAPDEAVAIANRCIELDPRYPEGYHMRGYSLLYLGRWADAVPDISRARELGNPHGWPIAKRAVALLGLGRFHEVQLAYDELAANPDHVNGNADALACVAQLLGRFDLAFTWLEKAVEQRALWVGFLGIEPLFAILRRDPRFASFCAQHRIPMHPIPPSAFDRLQPAP